MKLDICAVSPLIRSNALSVISVWEEKFREYLEDLGIGSEYLNAALQPIKERPEQFELKRRFVQSLVDKVTINKERKLQIGFEGVRSFV